MHSLFVVAPIVCVSVCVAGGGGGGAGIVRSLSCSTLYPL